MEDEEDRYLTFAIAGEQVRIERAKMVALASRISASPNGASNDAIFAAMSQLPGSEIGPAQELEAAGPGDGVPTNEPLANVAPADRE